MKKHALTVRRVKRGRGSSNTSFRKRRTRRQSATTARRHTFNGLRIAQDILDHNRTIVVYGNKIGVVYHDRTEAVYSPAESRKIINEFHEMFSIAKQCTMLCNPLRKKLQELLFICQPIGLTHARMTEHDHGQ